MSAASTDIIITANLSGVRSNLETAERESEATWRTHLQRIRKGAELSILFLETAGGGLDALLSMAIQTGLLLVDFATRAQAILVGATPLTIWSGIQIVALGIATTQMAVAIFQLQAGREQLSRRTYRQAQFFRAFSYG